jgi:hypothetical protein
MTERAAALVYRPDERTANARSTAASSSREGGPTGRRRARRSGANYVLVAILLLVGIWLLVVFGRVLTELNDATARSAAVSAESAVIEQRIAARRDEIVLAQSDGFMAMQARSFGMGLPGERAFALEPDAPPPPPVVPLGGEGSEPASRTPLEAWLKILLGDG